MTNAAERYYGKYRGTVIPPMDSTMTGKINALVTVGGAPMPVVADACTPFAGPGVGFYVIPPFGAGVWIEFEEGDLDKPIWTGCYWRTGEVPLMLMPDPTPPVPGTVILRSATSRLKLEMLTGIATLESLLPPATPATPVRVQITPLFVEISFSSAGKPNTINVSPLGVSINGDALMVL